MKQVFLAAAVAVSVLLAGCNPRGIFYDFLSYKSHESGTVHDAREITAFAGPVEPVYENVIQFFALGCAGAGNEGQRLVADGMAKLASKHPVGFVLYLGDNFYGRGVSSVNDPQWRTKFEDVYHHESLQIPFYAVLGNHDYYKNPDAQVAYTRGSPRWRMPARYYAFNRTLEDGTVVEFFGLDTEGMVRGNNREEQLEWLEEKLKNSGADWKIAYGHHPLYSGGFTWTRQIELIRSLLEPLFVEHHLDLYLSAHNHSIEYFRDISGVHYIVSGAGSRPRDVRWIDMTSFAGADLGFVWIRVFRDRMEVFIAGEDGRVRYGDVLSK